MTISHWWCVFVTFSNGVHLLQDGKILNAGFAGHGRRGLPRLQNMLALLDNIHELVIPLNGSLKGSYIVV